jgi:hypothetical protein
VREVSFIVRVMAMCRNSSVGARIGVLWLVALLALGGCAGPKEFPTPLETAEGDVITSHHDMMAFLTRLQNETGAFAMDTIGRSVEGRSLVLLDFTRGRRRATADQPRLKMLMFAQQHGNEPSGMEAALAMARDVATGRFSTFMESVDLYLIPQVNPDGSELRQRANAQGLDLNRDHLTLSTPEVAALHSVFRRLMPDVTLDVHEYGPAGPAWVRAGMHKDFGQQIDGLSNPNMSLELRTFIWDRVIPDLRERLAPQEVFLRRYLVSGSPEGRFRYSTTALNDGRNSMGIYNTLSFLIEGLNGLTVEENIRERTRQQLETMKAFALFFSENAPEVKGLVERERSRLLGEEAAREVALVAEYVQDPAQPGVTVGVINLETGLPEDRTFEAYYPVVETILSVRRPLGYAIPPRLTDVLDVLDRHDIAVGYVEGILPVEVEAYRIERVEASWLEDREFLDVGVSVRRREVALPQGTVVVWSDQLASNLIAALLEPQSQWGLPQLPEFSSLLAVRAEYPILRIVGTGD